MITSPPLRYYGAKFRLAKWILSYFPLHFCYVEPFGGGANVLLNKHPSPLEVYNDLDGDVVNFFDVLRTRTADLVRAIELTPYSKTEFFRAHDVTDDPLERARRFYIRSWQSRGGPTAQWRSGWRFERSRKWGATITDLWQNTGRLQATAWRLKQVQIENADALKVIAQFDTSQTLFYVDPPYVPDTRNKSWDHHAYRFEMDEAAHQNLARSLHEIEGMVILSGYPSPLYDDLFADWQMHTTRARTQNPNKQAVECLWLSPRTVAALGGKQMHFHMGGVKAK